MQKSTKKAHRLGALFNIIKN